MTNPTLPPIMTERTEKFQSFSIIKIIEKKNVIPLSKIKNMEITLIIYKTHIISNQSANARADAVNKK